MTTAERLASFEIIKRLGAGGMAEVFLAKKLGAEGTFKLLVLKRIHPAHSRSRRFRAMFVEEAHLATRLNHPNIVQVYEFIDHGEEGLLLAMEYVEGYDLGRLMSVARQKGTRIPSWVGAYIVAEAAKGLHYAHERRDEGGSPLAIVHRDVSPQNILLSIEGAVKIADFGIASANLFREEPGTLKGKFGYMSPEQARGERVDRRSDIYGLGVVLYEVLALRSPYAKKGEPLVKPPDDELLDAVKNGRFEPPSAHVTEIPSELESIVLRAMSLDREDRFQTARDMSGAIGRALLAKQEFVDASNIEHVLTMLLGKSSVMPSAPPASEAAQQTLAAIPQKRAPTIGVNGLDDDGRLEKRRPREVRHVAVLAMRLEGLADLEAAVGGGLAFKRACENLRATLDHIAYKRGARWIWDDEGRHELPELTTGIVGLLGNPSRAAFDAASLAVDVHEALAGASEDLFAGAQNPGRTPLGWTAQPSQLPKRVTAGIGIVRGIAAGERDVQGHLVDHVLQEPVSYLADRLGRRTPLGRTWVAGGLYRLVRRDFRWGDAPTLELDDADMRGIPRTMRTYALLRPLTREERAVEMALAPNDLVGRDAEKADLHAAYHRAVTPISPGLEGPDRTSSMPPLSGLGIGRSVAPKGRLISRAIIGEMGIGKTALVATFLSELPRDTRILSIECSPVKSEIPLAVLCDLLREATGVGLDHSLDEASAVFRGLLGQVSLKTHSTERLVTRLAEVATGKQVQGAAEEEGGHYRRDVLLLGVRYLLGALALEQPLVIVVDGLSWADRASLELVHELLKRDESLAILVVLVTRPDERVMQFVEGLVRIELPGLSAEEQVRLVEARLGVRDGVAAVCAELLPRVAGNPFFLLEMVDALLERGTLEIVERADGRHELRRNERVADRAEALPSTLEQLIGDRIRELPSAEHDVVDWLAVAGGPLLEADILALTRTENDEAMTRLCARGLCDRKQGVVDFRHPLARDVAYLALDAGSRVRMHRLLGEHLATTPLAQGLSAAIVARHLVRGEAATHAAELYLEAASAARNTNQSQLAQRYYLRSLSLLPSEDRRRLNAHEALEAIYRYLGRRRERRLHLAALRKLARREGQAKWAAQALIRTARLELDEGVLARGLPIAQRAADIARMAKNAPLEVEALTVLSEILRDLGDTQGAIAACERAIEVSEGRRVQPRLHAEVLRAKGVLLRYVGRVEEAVKYYVEALAIFRAVGARRSEARVMTSLAFAMFVLERFEEVIPIGLESVKIDLSIGGRFQIAKTLSNVGQAFARLGDLSRGLSFLRRAREAHERYADQDSRADTLLSTAGILIEAGDVDAAHTLAGDAGALVAVTGSVYDLVNERIIRASLARLAGDAQTAIAHALDARQTAEAQGLMSFHIYATAVEAAARVDAGEHHTGVLLARTAFGAIETCGGSEYGLEVRALCCEAIRRGSPSTADDAYQRAATHVRKVAGYIRDRDLKRSFLRRSIVERILVEAGISPLDLLGATPAPPPPAETEMPALSTSPAATSSPPPSYASRSSVPPSVDGNFSEPQ
ncbi:MAG: protein kinase [Polyangiaceae bacterium]|nr:protein kinase [Polyangiaceae bacterium]